MGVVARGQDITYKFRGIIYWYQGYNKGDKFRMEIYRYIPLQEKGFTWECERDTYLDCYNEFIKAPIFDGKTFWKPNKKASDEIGELKHNTLNTFIAIAIVADAVEFII